MRVLAWYTKNTEYEKIFKDKLLPSLEKFDIDYIVREVDRVGSWKQNVALKPKIIKEALEAIKEPILCLDVDCEIKKYPHIFEQWSPRNFQGELIIRTQELRPPNPDLACHILSWKTWYNRPYATETELLSGTIWLNYSEKVLELCDLWYKTAMETGMWEQKCLEAIIKKGDYDLYELSVEYCYIASMPGGAKPFVKCNPTIVHYQASRRMKKEMRKY